jgi:MFS transporter, DHA2 family, multidrug resistance protein
VRSLKATHPVVEVALLKVRPFLVGCVLSFCLGVGLFGAVYLMPVFLAFVRHHDALQIGSIMLVTGAAQLVAAPIAGALESRLNPRWLSAFGFSLFALGLGLSAFESRVADFDEMFWPQVMRGFAAMFCLLPPTRLALETLPHKQVPDASGLFNMMRNLGGAVGIALIDTVLYGRTSGHAEALRQRLIAGDMSAAQAIGLDRLPSDLSAAGPMIEQAAFAASANEAWALLSAVALFGLLLIPLAKPRVNAAGG